jgi:protein-tyrosine phosphatase
MAEWICRDLVQKRGLAVAVQSAGVYAFPGTPMTTFAQDVLVQQGIAVQESHSQRLERQHVAWADVIYTMTAAQKVDVCVRHPEVVSRIWTLGEVVATQDDVADPYGGSETLYAQTAEKIAHAVQRILDVASEGAHSSTTDEEGSSA